MTPATPGDPNVICHFCGCQSQHAYACRDCGHEFCLACVETDVPTPPQIVHCPACSSRNVQVQTKPPNS